MPALLALAYASQAPRTATKSPPGPYGSQDSPQMSRSEVILPLSYWQAI
jgi:hypothetical protein